MKISCDVNVRHLTRVEGHGNIKIRIADGRVEEATWEVVETPRFFEAMLVGKKWENAPYICARICGICSIGHTLASIRAVEDAFGFKPGVQTQRLRLLLKHMETLQSHILHLYFLAAPDFTRETEFVSLKGEQDYPFIGGDLVSTDGVHKKEGEYREMSNEYCTVQSTSKWSRLSRRSFAVGALARLNNNFHFLHKKAKELAGRFVLAPVCHNPFMNNIAQLVECMHVVEDAIDLIDILLAEEWQESKEAVLPRAGKGVGAVEVPRGILYHMYEFDGDGRIVTANCVIPTGQNHANIQHDIEALAKQSADKGLEDREIERLASMLVRAYDPCISCSVH